MHRRHRAPQAALWAKLNKTRAELDAQVRNVADVAVATRILARLEVHALKSIERNDDNVIVRVQRVGFLGEGAGRGQGVVVLRQADQRLGKDLKVVIEEPAGRGRVTIARGITIR